MSEDDGTTATRHFTVYRPQNLTNAPSNLVPAVLVFQGSTRLSELAPANRFIVVQLTDVSANAGWRKKWVNGASGAATPDDEPYVAAVVQSLITNENVDPQRLYITGSSSGGAMTLDVMCDPSNSPLFRGYLVDSSSFHLYPDGTYGTPNCPSTNTNYFAMEVLGDQSVDAPLYDNQPTPTGAYFFDLPHWTDFMAQKLGCSSTREDSVFGSPTAQNPRKLYRGPCEFAASGSAAVETIGAVGGGHQYNCQDSDANAPIGACSTYPNGTPPTDGLFVAQEFWDFVSSGASRF